MKIYLTGFMGSGKTLWGMALANEFGFDFIDLDALIEEKEQKSISQIFEHSGEQAFRQMEYQYLRQITRDHLVVATGGGCLANERNMNYALITGLVIFLNTNTQSNINYLLNNRNNRPLLKDFSPEQLASYVKSVKQERLKVYRKAHLVLDPDKMSPAMFHQYYQLGGH